MFSTFAADDRAQALEYARRFSQMSIVDGAFADNDQNADNILAEVGLSREWEERVAAATPHLIYGSGRLSSDIRDDLLKLGLTGEWPIAIARIAYEADIEYAGEAVKLHRYWTEGCPTRHVFLCATV